MRKSPEAETNTPLNLKNRLLAGALTVAAAMAPATAEAAPHKRVSEKLSTIERKLERRIDHNQHVTVFNRTVSVRIAPDGVFPTFRNLQYPMVRQRRGPVGEKPSIAAIKRGDFALVTVDSLAKMDATITRATAVRFNPDTMKIAPARDAVRPGEQTDLPLFDKNILFPNPPGAGFSAFDSHGEVRGNEGKNPDQIAFAYDVHK